MEFYPHPSTTVDTANRNDFKFLYINDKNDNAKNNDKNNKINSNDRMHRDFSFNDDERSLNSYTTTGNSKTYSNNNTINYTRKITLYNGNNTNNYNDDNRNNLKLLAIDNNLKNVKTKIRQKKTNYDCISTKCAKAPSNKLTFSKTQ